MVQMEKGLESGCKCPECGEECHDCMGSVQKPMNHDELVKRLEQLERAREDGE